MSNGISSLASAAGVNAAKAFGTKLDVWKNISKLDQDYIRKTIFDTLETREEILSRSGVHNALDMVLKPLAAVAGFMVGGPGGAAAGWSLTDAATDVAFDEKKGISPETRQGMDLAAQYHMQAPGTNLANDIGSWLKQAYYVHGISKGLVDQGVIKDPTQPLPKPTKPSIKSADPIDEIDIIDEVVPAIKGATSGPKSKVGILDNLLDYGKDTIKNVIDFGKEETLADAYGFGNDTDPIKKLFDNFQFYPAKKAVNGLNDKLFETFELDRPMIT